MKPKVKQAPKVQEPEVKEAPKVQGSEVKEAPIEQPQIEGGQIIIGLSGGLVVDKEYSVSAHTAKVLIDKGFATLKTT